MMGAADMGSSNDAFTINALKCRMRKLGQVAEETEQRETVKTAPAAVWQYRAAQHRPGRPLSLLTGLQLKYRHGVVDPHALIGSGRS